MSKTERRVFLAVIDFWSPATPSEISVRARMDIRTVSTMLGRLIHRGAVVSEGKGRKLKYSASERLYSIYFKLRRNRDKASVVHNLIRFMNAFYTTESSEVLFFDLIRTMDEFSSITDGFLGSLNDHLVMSTHLPQVSLDEIQTEVESMRQSQLKTRINKAFCTQDFHKVIQIVDDVRSSHYSETTQLQRSFILQTLLMKAIAQQKVEAFNDALSSLNEMDDVFHIDPSPELKIWMIWGLFVKGKIYKLMGKFGDALLIYEEVTDRCNPKKSIEMQTCIAHALVCIGEILMLQNERTAALSIFEEVVERFSASDVSQLQIQVSHALVCKVLILVESNDTTSSMRFTSIEATINFIDHSRHSGEMHLSLKNILH